MKYIVKNYPGMDLDKKKFLIKKAMKKHLEKGTIKQVKKAGTERKHGLKSLFNTMCVLECNFADH